MDFREQDIVLLSQAEPISYIWLNRPEDFNAFNLDLLRGLNLAIDKLLLHKNIRALIIASTCDEAFSVGFDYNYLRNLGEGALKEFVDLGQNLINKIRQLEFPVIGAANATTIGAGLELLLACDLIVASKAASFGQVEANLSLYPPLGSLSRIVERCGVAKAKRLFYTADIVTAEEAYHLGLIDWMAEEGGLKAKVHEITSEIVQRAPLSIKAAKKHLNSFSQSHQLEEMQNSRDIFLELFKSKDATQAIKDFFIKKKPDFEGC